MTRELSAALLTGGGDRHYAVGLATALAHGGTRVEVIGSDFLDVPELRVNPRIRFLNLRGAMDPRSPVPRKLARVLVYYARLIHYAARAQPRIFHILWNNRIEAFDRTVLMLCYRLFGRRIVMTVHNVNVRERDGGDGLFNRLTLRVQYRLCDRLFVHTPQMKQQLVVEFGVAAPRITVIPYAVNNAIPETRITPEEARARLRLAPDDRVMLFFGNIAPYKGLHHLVEAVPSIVRSEPAFRLLVAGRPKGVAAYWRDIEARIDALDLRPWVRLAIEYLPDDDIEVYFKAADVLVLPYLHIFQSGVLYLGYNFGLPAIVTDVGALKSSIVPGETGYACAPGDSQALADAVVGFFRGPLFEDRGAVRARIKAWALATNSWETVAAATRQVYQSIN